LTWINAKSQATGYENLRCHWPQGAIVKQEFSMVPITRPSQWTRPVIGALAGILIWSGIATALSAGESGLHHAQADGNEQGELASDAPSTVLLSVEIAVSEALGANPGLAEIKERARAASAIPLQVGTLADPVVSIGTVNLPTDTFSFTQETPTKAVEFGVKQAIPFPGKLGLRQEAAEFEAEAALEDVDELRLRLIRDVKSTWWHLYYLDRALGIVRENQNLMREFVQIAQEKYRVGGGLQSDVLLAEVELSKFLDREIRLVGSRRSAESRLNALLDRPADSAVQLALVPTIRLADILPEPALQELSEMHRPLLRASKRLVDASRKRHELAERDYFPDFSVSAAYAVRNGNNPMIQTDRADFFTARLGVSVPLYWNRKQAEAVRQRSAEQSQRKYGLIDDRVRVRREISTAVADYRRARDQAALLETGIIPQAEQTVAAMRAAYVVNKIDFLNLVSSQITLFEHQILFWLAQSQAKQALATLEAAVGTEDIGG
jgi:outer membrane protein TolC